MAATIEASNLSNTYEVFDMSSIATAVSTINVPFHGSDLYVVSVGDEAYTPMRPIIDGMGLTYQGQADKLKSRFSKGVREIMIPTKGGEQTMLCLALRKLNGWLQTISPNKVKPEIRDKVIQYQEECDDVLYEYWTKGEVKNPRKKTTVDDRTPLRGIVNRIMGKYGMTYQAVYKLVHKEFGVKHIDQLTQKQTIEAIEYLAKKVIEGEFLGKQELAPISNYNFPVETADPHDREFGNAWITPGTILDEKNRAPELELLEALENDGYDITGAKIRIYAMYGIAKQLIEIQKMLAETKRLTARINENINYGTADRGMNVAFTGNSKGLAYGGYTKRRLN